ncbi:MAG: adenosine kinase [Candidatus Aminicenantes bacterium]|nr:adenosine kinase [Candidatus Aminicenantes bacterium]
MKKVLGMGNALVDILIRIEDDELLSRLGFPRGSMTLVDINKSNDILELTKNIKKTESTGGSAANTINGLARFGGAAGYIGKVGEDELGKFFNSDLVRNKITARLFKGKEQTGRCVSLVSKDSERTMATYLGAAIELEAADLSSDLFKGYDYFHLEGYLVQNHDLVRKAVELAKAAGNEIAVDLSSFNVVEENLDFLKPIVKDYIDIVFANEDEAEAFTGIKDPETALAEIGSKCKIAVVKIGAEGSLIKSGGDFHRVSAIKAKAIDTTGAGDMYQAGFFYGLSRGYGLDICGKIGSIAAGKTVEVMGAKMGAEKWREVEDELEKLKI